MAVEMDALSRLVVPGLIRRRALIHVEVTQLVDGNVGVHVMIPKRLFMK